jgi:putative transposase
VRFMGPAVRLADSHHVRIARIGEVKTYESTRKLYRHLDRGTGKVVAATVTERSGKWTVSFTVEVTRQVPATREPERVIGVDVGITTLYTGATPDGTRVLNVENPRHFVKAEKRLAHAQRIASRRQGPEKGVAAVEPVGEGQRPGAEHPRRRAPTPARTSSTRPRRCSRRTTT